MSDDDICMAAMANFEQEQEDREYCIEIAPQIFVPDIQAGCSNIMSDDDICMAAMENFEKEVQNVNKDSYTTGVNGKRVSTANTSSAVRSKKKRIHFVQSPGFVEISASKARTVVWYYAKNTGGIQNYTDFLRSLESELKQLLKTRVQEHPIKFNLKLEAS
ncbi:uncharacterized protein LOC114125032 [Aphis gossypii]|uniref:uncharacterized protein LOC114125032 n=1 Tax=Aphis gossypii TaxID=80765 RepID=UPI0021597D9A|nr:uncharacterized protein LOC114125032 [Aphis gossypii]